MENMTKRQRYLAAMRREPTDGELVFAPNFDYGLQVNQAQGTVPEKYKDMSRNNIVRAIGGTIWHRSNALDWKYDKSIKHTYGRRPNGISYHEINTPVGSIYEEFTPTESEHSSYSLTKHLVTDFDSLKVMTYVIEGSEPTVNFNGALDALKEVGDDGIVLHQVMCVPFIQFAKTDVGYMNAYYLLEDYPEESEKLISAYHKKFVRAYKLLSGTPADVISICDNMDELTMPPNLFKKYATEFYQECKAVSKGSDKIMEVHWCGRTQHLLPFVPETGIDVLEAIVTEPMANITLDAALNILDGRVTLQGGLPSVLFCPSVISTKDFENYIKTVVLKQKGRVGYILGMSDNVPPDADFSRVEMIADLIK